MYFIPGALINILTFPGVICHEIAHKFFCDITNVPVYKVCYFDLKNSGGHVIHGEPKDLKSAVLISIGPLLINTVLCSLIGSVAIIPFEILNIGLLEPSLSFLLWVSISLGMHAFPSNTDMQSLQSFIKRKESNKWLLLVATLFCYLFKIANYLRFCWFDLLYAILIASLGPNLLIEFLK